MGEKVNGATLIARALKSQGVEAIFDLPGDPVGTILSASRNEGIRTYTFRHEQAAAMAAQAYGYVGRRLGVSVVASGPAMTNAVTSLSTAWANTWPMLLIGGASELGKRGMGDFQEMPQVEAAAPFCKWSVAVDRGDRIPWYIATAARKAMSGRPGPVYLDLPADIITGEVDLDAVEWPPMVGEPARPGADPALVEEALNLIAAAERPLLIVGKGVAWSDGASEARALVEKLQIAFIPSPMGKGVLPDDHPLAFQGARSYALRNADLVVLAGARFNWLFHFGAPPRFAEDVKVVQIDIDPDEIGNDRPTDVGLVGDAKVVLRQLTDAATSGGPSRLESPWLNSLREEREKNRAAIEPMVNSEEPFTNFYRMYREINEVTDDNWIICADGESTMAISRVMQDNAAPRQRLDAGVSGCMGVGVPYAIGAQVAAPDHKVLSVNGDFAFGWNGMEIETAVRHRLPILFMVANNGSIRPGSGAFDMSSYQPDQAVRYDVMMQAVGGHGEMVTEIGQLQGALQRALAANGPALINVAINPQGGRKAQEFNWLNRLGRMRYESR